MPCGSECWKKKVDELQTLTEEMAEETMIHRETRKYLRQENTIPDVFKKMVQRSGHTSSSGWGRLSHTHQHVPEQETGTARRLKISYTDVFRSKKGFVSKATRATT